MFTRCLITSLLVAGLAPVAWAGEDDVPGPGEPGGPIEPLHPAVQRQWLLGRALFDKNFTVEDGVGTPEMNADSCRACHEDPVLGGAGGLELNVFRFGYDNGGTEEFQDLPGGQAASKLRPPGLFVDREDPHPDADVFEQRQTPTVLGLGLIGSIPDDVILANEDPDDENGDGIRGVARRLMVNGQEEIGHFGWKAQVPKISDFIRDAMGGECGITTPDDGRGFAFVTDEDDVDDPELTQAEIDALEVFLQKLGPPLRGGSTDPQVAQGEVLFGTILCDRCHIPELEGRGGVMVPLYSDLLLHDVMGPDFRGMAEPGAPSGFFRTPPLWGVVDTRPYMHDGRASTLRNAILAHRGEAQASRDAFQLLDPAEQLALLAFLRDL